MSKGVLAYCFDTSETKYGDILVQFVKLVEKNLRLPVTVVTDEQTSRAFKNKIDVDCVLVEPNKNNSRYYKGKVVPWYNAERTRAYDISPYEQTLLLDIDYFCYTNNLLEMFNTDYDFLIHDKVNDITQKNIILSKNEATIPLLWATVIYFRKSNSAHAIFEMAKHVKKYYEHYCNLYRIKFKNFRNDFAFAIAVHQMNQFGINAGKIPCAMNMLPHEADVLEFDDRSMTFAYKKFFSKIYDTDVHIMNKEFCSG